jgi:hypothetical protein
MKKMEEAAQVLGKRAELIDSGISNLSFLPLSHFFPSHLFSHSMLLSPPKAVRDGYWQGCTNLGSQSTPFLPFPPLLSFLPIFLLKGRTILSPLPSILGF